MKISAKVDIDDLYWKYGTGQADILMSCGDVSEEVRTNGTSTIFVNSLNSPS